MPWMFCYDDEKKQMDDWERQHDLECPIMLTHKLLNFSGHPYGTIGGGRTYCFTPTSIGTFITVKCCCGAEFRVNSNL